jgi:acetolactate synthase-1/2/3 large subunit
MGLGAYPASGKNWLGMLGMHGTYEANWAMHDCDVMICIGARFDDRITGRLDAFSPGSRKIHVDIDPSSINKNVKVDVPIVGDCAHVLDDMLRLWRAGSKSEGKSAGNKSADKKALADWWQQIDKWRARKSLAYKNSKDVIKPQYAIQRLYELTKDRDVYITTEVGQHQMWAAQFFHFNRSRKWITSGGLGTMGYGVPAAIGAKAARPDATVICVDGDGCFQMTCQELATSTTEKIPFVTAIINNGYLGMVRQWQELFYDNRLSGADLEGNPDFVKLAQAYGAKGFRIRRAADVDKILKQAMEWNEGPCIVDAEVVKEDNVFPMIPAGAALRDMIIERPKQKMAKPEGST